MVVSGLSSNFYLSDNPIFINISNIASGTSYIEIILTRYNADGSVDVVSTPQKLYNLNNNISLDIAPLVKSFMPEPLHDKNYSNLIQYAFNNNFIKAKVTVNEIKFTYQMAPGTRTTRGNIEGFFVTLSTQSFTNHFIRGGKRTYDSNQNLVAGQNLLVTDTIPIWGGYPVDYYTTNSSSGIVKNNTIPTNLKEERSVKGCNALYVKFMNSLGGYSYWLFENYENEESNDNLGSVLRRISILDLGNDFDSEIELISKIPARYIALMKDLIISKEIYLYNSDAQTWMRILSNNNKIKTNPFDVNTKVKLKFAVPTRYNPSLLW